MPNSICRTGSRCLRAKALPRPNAAAQRPRFSASAWVGMRPWNPASSSGREPRRAIAATVPRIAETGVPMANSTRTTSAPRRRAASDDSR